MAAPKMIDQQLPFEDEEDSSDWKTIDDRIAVLEEKEDFEEAKRIALAAVQAAREVENGNSENSGQLLYTLECRANLYNRLGEYKEAKDDYLEAISFVAGQSRKEETVGRLYGSLGYLFECMGDEDQAIDAYERALEQLGRLREPAIIDTIRLTNNLAFIFSARDDFDQAETLFLKALKVAHDRLGTSSPDTTGIFNNIGALYQKAAHYEQAREMHTLALEGRKEDGSSEADIAQSHGNLAIVYAEEGDEQSSREHFDSAITSYQKAGPAFAEDFESVCANYIQLLKNVGDADGEKQVRNTFEKGL